MADDKFPVFSGMVFFPAGAFPIEDSPSRKRLPDENNKIVDFVRRLEDELLFVEAKSSFPNPNNGETPERFNEEIAAICEKFSVSLKLFSAIKVGVTEDALPDALSCAEKVQVTLALVIGRFSDDRWCAPIQKALARSIPVDIIRLWRPNVKVYTHASAKTYGLCD